MTTQGNADLLGRLKAIECPDATYPAADPALVLDRGAGSLVYDVEGRAYIDLCAGFGALALGHNPQAHQVLYTSRQGGGDTIAPAIVHGMGDVYPARAKVELLTALVELLPAPLAVAALAITGAQAVELAVKTAILATGRTGFITFHGGYHGLDLGILPLTARADFRAPFRDFCREDRACAVPFHCDEATIEDAVARLTASGAAPAAVIVEPVQGRAGVRPASADWLALLRRVCDRHGMLLIYDEVFTGLGRTGRMTHADLVPCDLLCLGKALGGGFPISACVGTRQAMAAWPASTGEALHTGTFFGHPLCCEAALATLRELVSAKLPERSSDLGRKLRARLDESLGRHPAVAAIRNEGLMLAVEFRRAGAGAALMDSLRRAGVIALACGDTGQGLSLTPALTIPEPLLASACDQLEKAVGSMSR